MKCQKLLKVETLYAVSKNVIDAPHSVQKIPKILCECCFATTEKSRTESQVHGSRERFPIGRPDHEAYAQGAGLEIHESSRDKQKSHRRHIGDYVTKFIMYSQI